MALNSIIKQQKATFTFDSLKCSARIERFINLHKKNIWKILLLGPIFLMFCDIISRIVIYPYEVPIGVTAGVFGALLFLVIINRRAK